MTCPDYDARLVTAAGVHAMRDNMHDMGPLEAAEAYAPQLERLDESSTPNERFVAYAFILGMLLDAQQRGLRTLGDFAEDDSTGYCALDALQEDSPELLDVPLARVIAAVQAEAEAGA